MDWVLVEESVVASWSSNCQGSQTSSPSSEIYAEDAPDFLSSSWSVAPSERSEGIFAQAEVVDEAPCCHIDGNDLLSFSSPDPRLRSEHDLTPCTPLTPLRTPRVNGPAEKMTPTAVVLPLPTPTPAVSRQDKPRCHTSRRCGSLKGRSVEEHVFLQQHHAASCKVGDEGGRAADVKRRMEADAQRRQIESDIDELVTLFGTCMSTSGGLIADTSPFCSYNAVLCPLTCRHFADMQEDGFPDYPLPERELHEVPTQFRMCIRRRRQQPTREWGSSGPTAFMV
eukprot:GEMP01020519.1.p1 GENE.GEMP01020519.1~~GEMP01020519.1.p1  ORF type:complete len:282 (+),score=76.08 GEMP01020519.1:82-927(+)